MSGGYVEKERNPGCIIYVKKKCNGHIRTIIAGRKSQARTQKLPAAAMEGGVFTITNLGGLWIDEFTPIINGPQTAILGVGAIRREPVVVADSSGAESIAIRDLMTLSLTFDHCRVDGGPAARFLDDLRRAIESPEGLG